MLLDAPVSCIKPSRAQGGDEKSVDSSPPSFLCLLPQHSSKTGGGDSTWSQYFSQRNCFLTEEPDFSGAKLSLFSPLFPSKHYR